MKFVRISTIELTAEESETLMAAGSLLSSIYGGMADDEYIFDDADDTIYDDNTVKNLANAMLNAGRQGLIIVTRR